MSQHRDPHWNDTGGPSGEIVDTLADVLRDQEERAKKRSQRPVPWTTRHRGALTGILLILAASSIYLWAFPPGWLSAPAARPPPPELLEAGVRMEIYLTALRVRAFQEDAGRLPNSLEEAGDAYSTVAYERLDSQRFSLSLRGPAGTLIYRSWEPLDGFLGDACEIMAEAGPAASPSWSSSWW